MLAADSQPAEFGEASSEIGDWRPEIRHLRRLPWSPTERSRKPL